MLIEPQSVVIRALSPDDAKRLGAIDAAATAFPWREEQFRAGLCAQEFGWGLELGGRLVGFAQWSQLFEEATLLNIAVAPERQRHGLARHLLEASISDCRRRNAERLLLEVRATNTSAIYLYRSFGFGVDGVRRNYYPSPTGREDAFLMSLGITGVDGDGHA